MSTTLLHRRPLTGATPAEIDELLRGTLRPPAEDYRQDEAALTIRTDVTMGDAYESAASALRQAQTVLEFIEVDDEAPEHVSSATGGAIMLLKLARAHLNVIRQGLVTDC